MAFAGSRGAFAFALCVLIPAFAGCADSNEASGGDLASAPYLDASTLTVRVTDDEMRPLEAAKVTLLELDRSNFTDADGRVQFTGLLAGSVKVRIEAYGHAVSQRVVDLPAGDRVEVVIVLVPVPVAVPYVDLRILAGVSSCTVPLLWGIFDFGGACGETQVIQNNNTFRVDAGDNWSFVKQELTWQGSHWFTMFSDNWRAPGAQVQFKHLSIRHGPSPVRVSAFPGEVAVGHDKQYFEPYPAKNASFGFGVFFAGYFGEAFRPVSSVCNVGHDAGCMGVGTSVESRFTLYVTVFHGEGPADWKNYTALPDQ